MFDPVRKKLVSCGRGWVVSLIFVLSSFTLCSEGLSSEVPQQISGLDLVSGKSVHYILNESSRATVVVFMSTRCPCSASHQRVLNQLVVDFGQKGIRFVGIHSNANESLEEARQYFSQANLIFPVIQDSGSVLAAQLEAFKTPHVYVLSSKTEILFQGGVDNSKVFEKATRHFLRDALIEIAQDRMPKEKSVRVVGCQIQRP